MSVLRADLLRGCVAALAGDPDPAIELELTRLGARTVEIAHAHELPVTALVYDASHARLLDMLDAVWAPVHQVATSLIAAGRPGKLVFLAPPQGEAARAALENLARTLSIEWARYGITTCALLAGQATSPSQLAGLVAYLLSPAGDYFSGCKIELGNAQALPSAQGTITASS